MPELPEVEALAHFLTDQVGGHAITRAELAAIYALKTFDPPLEALIGQTVKDCTRRGKHLCLRTTGPWLVLHLARGGWVQWRKELVPGRPKPGKTGMVLRVGFDTGAGFDVTEMGKEKRLTVHVVRELEDIERIANLGPDPLDPSFDADGLGKVLAGQGGQLKHVLTDQALLAGVGNAYSDEALHVAKLSPFKPSNKLTDEEVARLHDAIVSVLSDAVQRSAGLPASGLKSEKKENMRVHGRKGLPCPECGDIVREVSFSTSSLQYCPTCQTGGKVLADRRLSKLLK